MDLTPQRNTGTLGSSDLHALVSEVYIDVEVNLKIREPYFDFNRCCRLWRGLSVYRH